MAEHRAEVDAIIGNPEPPTFENTIVALERAGQLLSRMSIVFFNLTGTNSTRALRAIESEYAPKLTAHSDAIRLDPRLFARIKAVFEAFDAPQDAETARRRGSDAGQALPPRLRAGRRRARRRRAGPAGRTEPAAVHPVDAFQQNLLQATEDAVVLLDSADELDGLSPDAIATAADAATARGHDGKYAITLILPTGQPLLAVLRNRDVRRRLFEASINRANSGEHDNSPLVLEMSALRAQRARLLGFATHADAKVADQTVKTSAAIDEFLVAPGRPGGGERRRRGGAARGDRRAGRRRARGLGLGVLLRAGPGREV